MATPAEAFLTDENKIDYTKLRESLTSKQQQLSTPVTGGKLDIPIMPQFAFRNPSNAETIIGLDATGYNREKEQAQIQYDKQRGVYDTTATGIKRSFDVQTRTAQAEAAKAAEAFGIKSASTIAGLQSLDEIEANAATARTRTKDESKGAVELAARYVKESYVKGDKAVREVMDYVGKLGKDLNFAEAHQMQASVQAMTGMMEEARQDIMTQFSTDSPVYRQWAGTMVSKLGEVQSGVRSTFAQLRAGLGSSGLEALTTTRGQQDMYSSYARQTHVEAAKWRSELLLNDQEKQATFDVGIQQLRMAAMDDVANWLVATPVVAVDVMPMYAAMAEAYASATTDVDAESNVALS